MNKILGFVNYEKDQAQVKEDLRKMNKQELEAEETYISNMVAIGNCSWVEKYSFGDYVLSFQGQIYNRKELKRLLLENEFSIESDSDSEILLKGFIHFGYEIVKYLNGMYAFSIWNQKAEELYLARDHFGIKPLFYTQQGHSLIFASQLKDIFQYPNVEKTLNEQGISELFGIGPAHTPGMTVFKDVYELRPAHYAIFNRSGLHVERYWKLKSKEHTDSFGNTCSTLKDLLQDSIYQQLPSDKPICTFLSGGLDSSIITKFATNYCRNNGLETLNTYSVDYVDNDKNFVKSDFQPNSDKYYIELMKKNLNTNHHNIVIDTPELANYLEDAMIARDMPGMADIDSSLLLFCKEVKPEASVALTGECADEIFAGYPWFFREDSLNSHTFPWSLALSERQEILHPNISNKVDIKGYVANRYEESLNEIDILDSDSKETAEKRKISHLTLNWFMQTLLDRSERMAAYNNFEIRVPFCDYRLAEYVWNIPWEIKALNGREKGLLRYISRDILPSEIVDRKKSPYPKTHNPTYLNVVKDMLTKIMRDKNAPINYLLNREYILNIIETEGKSFTRPWFGQLMTGPQLMAYLVQVNMWLEKYQPKLEV